MSKAKKSNVVKMYKRSFGHFKDGGEAHNHMNDLQKTYPDKKLQVVLEKRQTKYWKKYCVCEYLVTQKNQDQKKSNKG